MVNSVNMDTPGRNTPLIGSVKQADKTARQIAFESSQNVLSMASFSVVVSYPIPEELKMAIENSSDIDTLPTAAKAYSKILSCLKSFKDIRPNHYWFLMKLLIYLDHYQCIMDMAQHTLYKQKIRPSTHSKKNMVISVPGLVEDRPSLRNKDIVIINQIDGNNHGISKINYVSQKYVTVKMEDEFLSKFEGTQEYNIFFLYPEYSLNCLHYAVDRATKFGLLTALFPTGGPTQKIQQHEDVDWVNENIKSNPEQQQAVLQILARSAYPAPYVLFGPPGTGKTSTLVEAIGQILRKSSGNRILVCTPSNAAADEVAQRLLQSYVDGREMHRMYSLSRDCTLINDVVKPYSNFADGSGIFISKEILKTKKVVITTLMACHRLISYKFREDHFTYVFVDEAGQATEPETLIPMTLMSSMLNGYKGRLNGQLVIAGDPKQLGPIVMSRIAEPLLGRSMLERLMEWDLYRKNPINGFDPSYVTKLVRNYRCHPTILHVPNELFYDGELKACGGLHTQRGTKWKKLPNKNFPIIFHAVEGREQRDIRSPSVFNSKEISVIISYVKDLLSSSLGGTDVQQREIGIVTPYKLQREKIHDELRRNNWTGVEVGTVETFQGQEKDIMIISTVRSGLYCHGGRVHIGFLSNPKRFNVALTRAKALLIVVGNPVILQIDECWRKFILYCVENKACLGSKFQLKPLSNKNMRDLMVQKHVTIKPVDSEEPTSEIVEDPPVERKIYKLPQKCAERRRRLPEFDFQSEETDSEEFEATHDPDIFDSLSKYINRGETNDHLDFDDDEDMEGYFSDNSLHDVESPSVLSAAPICPEYSWDAASSTTTTDPSEKSPDPNEDISDDQHLNLRELASLLPDLTENQIEHDS